MSLIICVKNSDSIVLASDSGELMLGATSKITVEKPKIENLISGVWIASVSNVARFADWIISYFKECMETSEAQHLQRGLDITNVYGATSAFAHLVKDYQTEFISNWQKSKETPLSIYTEFIICGFSPDGIPKINKLTNFSASCPPFAPEEIRKDYCLAGHPVIPQHYISRIERLLPIGEMDTSSIVRLVIFLINETLKADDEIRLPIYAIILKHNAPAVEISQDEIEAIRVRMSEVVDDKKIISAITERGVFNS